MLIPLMLLYFVFQDKRKILDFFYLFRGIPHGYLKGKLRIAKYSGLRIVFPFIEDPAFDDVWLRDVYQEYIPKKDDVVVDVGAHMGFFTLKVARVVKKVIAVEPDPVNFQFLLQNVDSNKFTDKTILSKVALGRDNGSIFLDRTGYGFGRSRSTWKKTNYPCKMQTLSSLVLENNLNEVNLIKIDTEGFELDILEGAIAVLQRYKPDLIIAAYHFPQESQIISDFLKKYDYSVTFYCIPLFLFGGKETYLYAKANNASNCVAS